MIKLKNKEIVELLKEAKIIYLNHIKNDTFHMTPIGMCNCISTAYRKLYNKAIFYDNIKYIIPKFNKTFVNSTSAYCYWWPLEDNISRIKALDKLIFYYKYKAPVYDFINKIKCIFKWYIKNHETKK